VAIQASDATRGRAFTLEPYSYAEVRTLMEELDLAEPVAVTLVRRGHRTVAEARTFLEAAEAHDPFEFDSMGDAVGAITDAIAARRRITVHGDYDCDGVCAVAILIRALRELGANCDWYIPDRLGDGYGLTQEGVRRLAARGTELLLTVDCGITCAEEVAAAKQAGMDVIVTDHHEPPDHLPGCTILHPRLSGYPCGELCATGVAYKLSVALLGEERARPDLDLVALATVADLVPLCGENRALVRAGLAEARTAARAGWRALCAVARVEPGRLDEGDLAFRLGPRINAAGRLYRADAGVELLLADDPARASAIAGELDRANRERRDAERAVVDAAERARTQLPQDLGAAPALVLAGEGWHPGVVGIAASRLAERHGIPVVLIGVEAGGRGRGSGRSIPGFDLLAALDECAEHLSRYGGHRAAAGIEIEAGRIESFREAFVAHARKALAESDLISTEPIDAVVGGESLGHDVAEQFEHLGPFGMGNPGVRLLVPSARVLDVRPMGDGDKHARFRLQSGSHSALGVAFGVNGELSAARLDEPIDISVRLELNEWNGAVEPRVVLGELYPGVHGSMPGESPRSSEEEWWHRVAVEREVKLEPWPSSMLMEGSATAWGRDVVDRRGSSGVASVAALASSGERVLALCADAVRRRALVERAAVPARFGGGTVAIASGRFADEAVRAAVTAVAREGSGVVLADWAALMRHPSIPTRFEHVVLIDPPPFPHLERLASTGAGFLHLAWGRAEFELALRVHEADWPQRHDLAATYLALRDAAGGTATSDGDDSLISGQLREILEGPWRHPRSPEIAARRLRVLEEVGAIDWEGSAAAPVLRVVSSEAKDLERSKAFVAYRERSEDGKRFLSRRSQPS
jgi:single-stranded-DNA-specific exonuclease